MFSGEMRVYIAVGVTDMRKAIDGLSIMVKVLYWDRNGICLWQKRLETDHFRWPESRQEVLEVDRRGSIRAA